MPITRADGSTQINFRVDRAQLDRLEEVRRMLSERAPGVKIGITDAVKFLIHAGSSSVLNAQQQETKTAA